MATPSPVVGRRRASARIKLSRELVLRLASALGEQQQEKEQASVIGRDCVQQGSGRRVRSNPTSDNDATTTTPATIEHHSNLNLNQQQQQQQPLHCSTQQCACAGLLSSPSTTAAGGPQVLPRERSQLLSSHCGATTETAASDALAGDQCVTRQVIPRRQTKQQQQHQHQKQQQQRQPKGKVIAATIVKAEPETERLDCQWQVLPNATDDDCGNGQQQQRRRRRNRRPVIRNGLTNILGNVAPSIRWSHTQSSSATSLTRQTLKAARGDLTSAKQRHRRLASKVEGRPLGVWRTSPREKVPILFAACKNNAEKWRQRRARRGSQEIGINCPKRSKQLLEISNERTSTTHNNRRRKASNSQNNKLTKEKIDEIHNRNIYNNHPLLSDLVPLLRPPPPAAAAPCQSDQSRATTTSNKATNWCGCHRREPPPPSGEGSGVAATLPTGCCRGRSSSSLGAERERARLLFTTTTVTATTCVSFAQGEEEVTFESDKENNNKDCLLLPIEANGNGTQQTEARLLRLDAFRSAAAAEGHSFSGGRHANPMASYCCRHQRRLLRRRQGIRAVISSSPCGAVTRRENGKSRVESERNLFATKWPASPPPPAPRVVTVAGGGRCDRNSTGSKATAKTRHRTSPKTFKRNTGTRHLFRLALLLTQCMLLTIVAATATAAATTNTASLSTSQSLAFKGATTATATTTTTTTTNTTPQTNELASSTMSDAHGEWNRAVMATMSGTRPPGDRQGRASLADDLEVAAAAAATADQSELMTDLDSASEQFARVTSANYSTTNLPMQTSGQQQQQQQQPEESISQQVILLEGLLNFGRIFLMGAIIVGDICGNSLVILSVCRHSKLRVTTNWFVVSLACADILVALFAMTFNASVIISGRWLFKSWVCDFWNSCDVLASTASILHLCCISIDRYIAIMRPLEYPTKITTRKVMYALCGVWISSALLSYIPIFTGIYTTSEHIQWLKANPDQCEFVVNRVYAIVSSSISFWIPCCIMTCLYYKIYREATRQEKLIYKAQSIMPAPMPNHHHHHHHNHSSGGSAAANAQARAKQRRSKSMAVPSSAAAAATASAAGGGGGAFTSNELKIRQLARHQQQFGASQTVAAAAAAAAAPSSVLGSKAAAAAADSDSPLIATTRLNEPGGGVAEPSAPAQSQAGQQQLKNDSNNNATTTATTTPGATIKQVAVPTTLAPQQPVVAQTIVEEEELGEPGAGGVGDEEGERDSNSGHSTPTKRSISKMKREHKAFKTLGIIMGVFILCWLPFFIWYTHQHICGHACDGMIPREAVTLLFWIGYFNSMLNPIIYAYFNHEFRDAFKKTLQWIFSGCCQDLKCLRVSRPNDNQHYNCTYRSTQEIGLVSNG